jgi:putative transposase
MRVKVRTYGRTRAGGYQRIASELRKLAISVARSSVRRVLLDHGLRPAPRRDGPSWRQFLRQQAAGSIACDFFCVETILLRRRSVLFFSEIGAGRVHLAGQLCDAHSVAMRG